MVGQKVHACGRGVRLRGPADFELGEDGVNRQGRVSGGQVLHDSKEQLQRRDPLPAFLTSVGGHIVQTHLLDEQPLDGSHELVAGFPRSTALQEPKCLADLGPVEESPSPNREPYSGARQRILDWRQLGVHTHQHGRLRRCDAGRRNRSDPGQDVADFGLRVHEPPNGRGRAVRLVRPQRSSHAAGNDPVGEFQNLWAGAVVVGESHNLGAGMPRRKSQQEVGRGPGEGVDVLVGIAHDCQIARLPHPQFQEPLRQWIGVLILVDAEPAFARSDQGRRLGVIFEQLDRLDQHVLEVEQARRGLGSLVVAVDAAEQLGWYRSSVGSFGRPLLGSNAPDLGPFDGVGYVLGRCEAIAPRQPADQRDEQAELRVENCRQWRTVVAARPEVSQLSQRGGVKRTGDHAAMTQRGDPLGHLVCGLVGERHEQDLTCRNRARLDRVSSPPADHPSLARTRAGDNRQRPRRRSDGLTLR